MVEKWEREREQAPPPPSQSHTHNPPRGKSRDSINKTKYSKTSFAEIIHVQNRELFYFSDKTLQKWLALFHNVWMKLRYFPSKIQNSKRNTIWKGVKLHFSKSDCFVRMKNLQQVVLLAPKKSNTLYLYCLSNWIYSSIFM